MSDNHHLNLFKTFVGEINHYDLLSEHIGSLFLNEEYADVIFMVEGNRFPAHKFILASRSEYFRALLYGGMKESLPGCNEIELKDAPGNAFKILLKYIYTGKMNLTNHKEETLLEIIGLANQYGFTHLESAISDYLKAILTVKNVCMIFDMANLYRLHGLRETCFQFMDRHSTEILENKIYLSLSASAMYDMIRRDSFCALEGQIFSAVYHWSQANPDTDPTEILAAVRYPLLSLQEIMDTVRPTGLIPAEHLLDSIREKLEKRNSDLNYRGFLSVEENVATFRHGAHVILGEKRSALLDGDTVNYDLDRGFTRHPIDDQQLVVSANSNAYGNNNMPGTSLSGGSVKNQPTSSNTSASANGIIIKLGMQCIINHIKLLLWDKDMRAYSYYIETAVDQNDWVRVVDHSKYLCRSWQNLYFIPRVVRYIKIVGTHNTVNRVFHIIHFEAMYTCKPFRLLDGLVCPTENVASLNAAACVIEGVSRSRNALINGDFKNYDWDSGYTCHQLGSGSIIIQLAQPYVVSSFRLLLWDCDDRAYKYKIETSIDQVKWTLAVDKTRELCKSWQILTFPSRPVIFIKIEGTYNTANEVFHCVHFECPSTIEIKGDNVPPSPTSKSGVYPLLKSSCNNSSMMLATSNSNSNIINNNMNNVEYYENVPGPSSSYREDCFNSHHSNHSDNLTFRAKSVEVNNTSYDALVPAGSSTATSNNTKALTSILRQSLDKTCIVFSSNNRASSTINGTMSTSNLLHFNQSSCSHSMNQYNSPCNNINNFVTSSNMDTTNSLVNLAPGNINANYTDSHNESGILSATHQEHIKGDTISIGNLGPTTTHQNDKLRLFDWIVKGKAWPTVVSSNTNNLSSQLPFNSSNASNQYNLIDSYSCSTVNLSMSPNMSSYQANDEGNRTNSLTTPNILMGMEKCLETKNTLSNESSISSHSNNLSTELNPLNSTNLYRSASACFNENTTDSKGYYTNNISPAAISNYSEINNFISSTSSNTYYTGYNNNNNHEPVKSGLDALVATLNSNNNPFTFNNINDLNIISPLNTSNNHVSNCEALNTFVMENAGRPGSSIAPEGYYSEENFSYHNNHMDSLTPSSSSSYCGYPDETNQNPDFLVESGELYNAPVVTSIDNRNRTLILGARGIMLGNDALTTFANESTMASVSDYDVASLNAATDPSIITNDHGGNRNELILSNHLTHHNPNLEDKPITLLADGATCCLDKFLGSGVGSRIKPQPFIPPIIDSSGLSSLPPIHATTIINNVVTALISSMNSSNVLLSNIMHTMSSTHLPLTLIPEGGNALLETNGNGNNSIILPIRETPNQAADMFNEDGDDDIPSNMCTANLEDGEDVDRLIRDNSFVDDELDLDDNDRADTCSSVYSCNMAGTTGSTTNKSSIFGSSVCEGGLGPIRTNYHAVDVERQLRLHDACSGLSESSTTSTSADKNDQSLLNNNCCPSSTNGGQQARVELPSNSASIDLPDDTTNKEAHINRGEVNCENIAITSIISGNPNQQIVTEEPCQEMTENIDGLFPSNLSTVSSSTGLGACSSILANDLDNIQQYESDLIGNYNGRNNLNGARLGGGKMLRMEMDSYPMLQSVHYIQPQNNDSNINSLKPGTEQFNHHTSSSKSATTGMSKSFDCFTQSYYPLKQNVMSNHQSKANTTKIMPVYPIPSITNHCNNITSNISTSYQSSHRFNPLDTTSLNISTSKYLNNNVVSTSPIGNHIPAKSEQTSLYQIYDSYSSKTIPCNHINFKNDSNLTTSSTPPGYVSLLIDSNTQNKLDSHDYISIYGDSCENSSFSRASHPRSSQIYGGSTISRLPISISNSYENSLGGIRPYSALYTKSGISPNKYNSVPLSRYNALYDSSHNKTCNKVSSMSDYNCNSPSPTKSVSHANSVGRNCKNNITFDSMASSFHNTYIPSSCHNTTLSNESTGIVDHHIYKPLKIGGINNNSVVAASNNGNRLHLNLGTGHLGSFVKSRGDIANKYLCSSSVGDSTFPNHLQQSHYYGQGRTTTAHTIQSTLGSSSLRSCNNHNNNNVLNVLGHSVVSSNHLALNYGLHHRRRQTSLHGNTGNNNVANTANSLRNKLVQKGKNNELITSTTTSHL